MQQISNTAVLEQKPPVEQSVNTAPGRQMPSPETIRKHYLNHEAGVKSIGTLYYIGAALLVISGAVNIFRPTMDEPLLPQIAACMALIAMGGFLVFVGHGLKTLRPWSRIATFVLACIGLLLGFPLGTVINGYILYLVASKKGVDVFSSDYKAVLAATPHIRYKTSIVGWIILSLGALLIGLMIVAALTAR